MILAVGEKVSWKSTPSSCVNPLATMCAFYRSIEPSERCLILYTHLQLIGVLPAESGVRDQVPFS